jgi:hypothetical protein
VNDFVPDGRRTDVIKKLSEPTEKLVVKRTLSTLLVACSLCCVAAAVAKNGASHTVAVSYIIRSLGSDIGTVSAKTNGTARDNDFRADVTVNVRFWFISFSLTSTETASIRDGKLVRYRKSIDTKGHRREIAGERNGDVFSIVIRDGKQSAQKEYPAAGYVTTNMEYPEVTLAPGEVRRIRVMDLENSEIVDREYRHVADEQAEIDGRTRVIVSDFSDKNSEGRRWTAIVGGVPVVIRQEGKEKTGLFNPSYAVRQTGVTLDKE